MKYKELKELKEKNNTVNVCLFGAGLIGSTWAYDLISTMGFCIDFYCDNRKVSGIEIRDGIKTRSIEELYAMKEKVLVFITVSDKNQRSIEEQLVENGIHNIVRVDYLFMQTFIESLLEMNNRFVNEKFKCILDDEEYISRQFEYHFGHRPNLETPRTFNEKIQWLKLHDRNPQYTQLVDKYEVKKYISDKIGEGYVIPTLGIYNSFDEINFEQLPEQFVLKCTHDSGSIVICKSRAEFDQNKARNILENGLKKNFYWWGREWPYKNVKPRIIAECYLSDKSKNGINDYKIFCFNGRAELIQVDYGRFINHKRNLYTLNWEYIDAMIKYPNDPKTQIERPSRLKEMINLAEQLSANIPHVRLDLYLVNDKVYFGELTFHHGSGYENFRPLELENRLGEMITL